MGFIEKKIMISIEVFWREPSSTDKSGNVW